MPGWSVRLWTPKLGSSAVIVAANEDQPKAVPDWEPLLEPPRLTPFGSQPPRLMPADEKFAAISPKLPSPGTERLPSTLMFQPLSLALLKLGRPVVGSTVPSGRS